VHQTYDQGNAAKHVADVGLLCFAPNRRNIGLEVVPGVDLPGIFV